MSKGVKNAYETGDEKNVKMMEDTDLFKKYYGNNIDWGYVENNCILSACKGGNLKLVKKAIEMSKSSKSDYTEEYIDKGLNYICRSERTASSMEIEKFLIDSGANINEGLLGACVSNNRETMNRMIELGGCDWDYGLYGACEGGHEDLMNEMIERGAENFSEALSYACKGYAETRNVVCKRIIHILCNKLHKYEDEDKYEYKYKYDSGYEDHLEVETTKKCTNYSQVLC
jgi:hypothetical protein